MMASNTDKLIYLATHNKINVPKPLQKYVGHYDLLSILNTYGLEGASAFLDASIEGLQKKYTAGRDAIIAGREEDMVKLVSRDIYDGIQKDDKLEINDKLRLFALLAKYSEGKPTLIERDITDFTVSENGIELLPTGFEPLDTLVDGVIPGSLITVAANSGHGKTSVLLSMVDAIQKAYPDKRVVFISLEMTAQAVQYRAKHLSLQHNKSNVLDTGVTHLAEIEEYLTENTILVLDYVDILVQTASDGLRFALMDAYAKLLTYSKKCFLIFSPTQVNRASSVITLASLSESNAKSFYSELVISLSKEGESSANKGYNQVTMRVLKNRYGRSDNAIMFDFDYNTLHYTESYPVGTVQYDKEASELLDALYDD